MTMIKVVTSEAVVRLGLILSDQTLTQKTPHWGDEILPSGKVRPMPHRQIALALGRDSLRHGVVVLNYHSFGEREVWLVEKPSLPYKNQFYTPGVWGWYLSTEPMWAPTTYKVEDVAQVQWTSATSGASITCWQTNDSATGWIAEYRTGGIKVHSHYGSLWADMR